MYGSHIINYRLMDYVQDYIKSRIEDTLLYTPDDIKTFLEINNLMNVVDTSKYDDAGLGMVDEKLIDMMLEEIKSIL